MPHPIIEISELTQLVADHLLPDGQKSLVSLACTCRALKEQALRTLWSEQQSLKTLVGCTLPPGTSSYSQPLPQPTRIEWDKFQLYASWMRRLRLDFGFTVPEEVLRMISAHSSNGIVFPGLRDLAWWVQPHTLPFYRLFLSPYLTEFVFVYLPFEAEVTDEVLSGMTSVILELETFPLRHLYLDVPATMSPSLNSAVSSAVLRCGSSLDTLLVSTPLSDAAVQHIMGLPKFTSWYAMNGPPKGFDLSLSDAFPQLEILELRTETSLEWIPVLGTTPRRTSSGQDTHAPLHRGPGQNLTVLESCVAAPVDAAFMSPIIRLHELVELRLESSCSNMGGCTFSLTDGDVAEIATALPNLVNVTFGEVCPADSCKTTARSLLFLSTSCNKLETLEIHFNTRNLRDDLESIPENPRLHGLCGLPRCRLEWLTVANAPLRISEEDHGSVVAGFLRIFQSVERVSGVDVGWDKLSSRLCNQE